MEIRISGIIEESIVDGPGIRYVIFTQGCPHNCRGCHNPHTHDFNGGSIRDCDEIINEFTSNSLLDGITLSGGEPFVQPKECSYIAENAHRNNLSVIIYTGYDFEEIYAMGKEDEKVMEFLKNADILIDGKFIMERKNILLKFIGSDNQRIIDVKETLKNYEHDGNIILYRFEDF